jgi:hypothetical protein
VSGPYCPDFATKISPDTGGVPFIRLMRCLHSNFRGGRADADERSPVNNRCCGFYYLNQDNLRTKALCNLSRISQRSRRKTRAIKGNQ